MTLRKGDDGLPGIQVLLFPDQEAGPDCLTCGIDCLISGLDSLIPGPDCLRSGLDCPICAIFTGGKNLFNMTLRKGDDGLPGIQVRPKNLGKLAPRSIRQDDLPGIQEGKSQARKVLLGPAQGKS